MPINNSVEMYGITRCKSKSGNSSGWQIMIGRRGVRFSKWFPDLTWGSPEKALAAAKCHRDAMVQLLAPLTMREYMQSVKANNTSGIVGVCSSQAGSGMLWSASIQLPGGKRVRKSFSESVYGSRARELAIQARQEMLNLVDETSTYTCSPGAIVEANPAQLSSAPPLPPRALTVRVRRTGINGGVVNKNIYVSVSDAISPRVKKTFSAGVHGQAGAFRFAMQAALRLVTQFGGEDAAQIFIRDYVEKHKRLPKKGISARIRFMPVEDSTNHNIYEA